MAAKGHHYALSTDVRADLKAAYARSGATWALRKREIATAVAGGRHLRAELVIQRPDMSGAQPSRWPFRSGFVVSVRVVDDAAGCEAEVLDCLVEDSLSFGGEGGVLGLAGAVSRVSVLGHPPHDVGEIAGGVGDS
jgi:hypothetical protein